MHDVARLAGVSLKTVSRIINGEAGVTAATAQRVSDAIEELGYHRNDVARNLKQGGSTSTIGLVIGDVGNPFYSLVARAVEDVARKRGCLLLTGSSDENAQRERELIGNLITRRVDGLVVVPAGLDERYLRRELEAGLHAVFVDRTPVGIDADSVVADDVGGAQMAVRHLLGFGHTRIALVGDSPVVVYTARERAAGYRAALEEAGIGYDETLVRMGPHDTTEAEAAARHLLLSPAPPTAIFTTNNRMTLGTLRAIHRQSANTALVGFDDFELADMLPVPVTVVSFDAYEMGRRAAELLFSRLAGDGSPPQRIVIPTKLTARGSGELGPPIADASGP